MVRRTSPAGFPLPDEVTYSTSPLTLALCQVSFPPILGIARPEIIGSIQAELAVAYPQVSIEQAQSLQLNVTPEQMQAGFGQTSTMWRFSDRRDEWSVVIGTDFLTLETRGYRHYEDFEQRLVKAVEVFGKIAQPGLVARIGLRYVNEIRSDLNWNQIVHTRLLGAIDEPIIRSRVTQSFQQITLVGDDMTNIVISHGAFAGGSAVAPQRGTEPPTTPFYLLDIDVGRNFAPSNDAPTLEDIVEHVDYFHMSIWSIFRWAVSSLYLDSLGGNK